MHSTHEVDLDIPALPLAACRVNIVPVLATLSLLSMGQLCDSGCQDVFFATTVRVTLDDKLIMAGTRTSATGLWHLDLVMPSLAAEPAPPPTESPILLHHSFAAVQSATPADLVALAHASLLSPALSTLKTALDRGYLPDFMGLTSKTLTKSPPQSVAMIKVHMYQARKNQRSTKPNSPHVDTPTLATEDFDTFPLSDDRNERTHHCFAAVIKASSSGQIHTDQTGRFIAASSMGNNYMHNNYMLVLYDYDSNSIIVESLRSRTGPCILAGYKVLYARLIAEGLRPKLQQLDKECFALLKSSSSTSKLTTNW